MEDPTFARKGSNVLLLFRIQAGIGYRLTISRGILLVALVTPFTFLRMPLEAGAQ
jgi:hypothetical protein